jgi:heptosyltransferase-2
MPLMVNRYLSLIGNQKISSHLYPKFKTDNISQVKTIALCPGASYGLAKKWPIANFKQLATELTNNNYKIFVFGSKAEQADGEKISANNDNITNYAGQMSLQESIAKLSTMETVITNDSGLMHIACALQSDKSIKKVITIFGSSTPKHTPPLNDKAIVLETELKCRPCFAKTCQYRHYDCLTKITVKQVLDKI